jgi:NAD/NADP transhydrogenase alpha subunit
MAICWQTAIYSTTEKQPENVNDVPWWFKGGIILEAEPAGKIVWEFRHPHHHHDVRRLANENVIVLAMERIPLEFAAKVKDGLPGTERNGAILADVIYEATRRVKRFGAGTHTSTSTRIKISSPPTTDGKNGVMPTPLQRSLPEVAGQ